MSITAITVLSTLLLLLPGIHGLGINCRGSYVCGARETLNTDALGPMLQSAISRGWGKFTFGNGEKIGCVVEDSFFMCAYMQHLADNQRVTLLEAYDYFIRLRGHGCRLCGSAPIDAATNDVSTGEFTINYVVQNCQRCRVDGNPCTDCLPGGKPYPACLCFGDSWWNYTTYVTDGYPVITKAGRPRERWQVDMDEGAWLGSRKLAEEQRLQALRQGDSSDQDQDQDQSDEPDPDPAFHLDDATEDSLDRLEEGIGGGE